MVVLEVEVVQELLVLIVQQITIVVVLVVTD